ncbi:hypothetical protein [Litoreibacter roseus]|uniref:Uncharacterized protein n=1 Tax=Litoreibacter roseus TaxID=2601869 RepID=A0A6N6JEX5_9RHOB|nr:hypothetical protein [Litoreibacter roseus]GFE64901.1 hypothetical protein KIN_19750 [Litoreibacter roseus]
MSGWRLTKLTQSLAESGGISHSYYDIPVFDEPGAQIIAHRLPFTMRHPGAEDAVEIGLVGCNAAGPDNFQIIGESRAWSWQQGPMAQWIAGGPRVVWNDREDGKIVARVKDTLTGDVRTLPGQVYAIDAAGKTALSLDMTRLDALRAGYGYPGGVAPDGLSRAPADDGVWAMDIETGHRTLLLDIRRAVGFMNKHRGWRDYIKRQGLRVHYWFNHAKISPDGTRFTIKLRWRRIGRGWDDRQGVSLTCKMDGSDLRFLAPATSHVIWLDSERLYFWQRNALRLYLDSAPLGTMLHQMAPDLVTANVHMRHLDDGNLFVLDTPYNEKIDVITWDAAADVSQTIATFTGHVPKSGPFRCDLHPCPSADGKRIALTSLQDGARDVYLLDRMG